MSSPDPLDCIDLPISLSGSSDQPSQREVKRRRINSPPRSSDLPPDSPPAQRYEPVYEPPSPVKFSPTKVAQRRSPDAPREKAETAREDVHADDGPFRSELELKDDNKGDGENDATETDDRTVNVGSVDPLAHAEDEASGMPSGRDVVMQEPVDHEEVSMQEGATNETVAERNQDDTIAEATATPVLPDSPTDDKERTPAKPVSPPQPADEGTSGGPDSRVTADDGLKAEHVPLSSDLDVKPGGGPVTSTTFASAEPVPSEEIVDATREDAPRDIARDTLLDGARSVVAPQSPPAPAQNTETLAQEEGGAVVETVAGPEMTRTDAPIDEVLTSKVEAGIDFVGSTVGLSAPRAASDVPADVEGEEEMDTEMVTKVEDVEAAGRPSAQSRASSQPAESRPAARVEAEEELDTDKVSGSEAVDGYTETATSSGAASPVRTTPAAKPKKASKAKPKSKIAEVKARERAGSSLAPSDVTSSEKEGEELLCLCRKIFDEEDEEGIMVACDGGCEGWYHPGCIGMSEDDLQRLDKYICDKCAKDTTQRTVYHQQCARSECSKPVGARSSKYCSSSCAFNHMAGFIPQTPSSKLLKQLSAAFIGLPRPSSRIKVTHHEAAGAVTRDDQVQKQLEVVEQSMAMLRRRQQIVAQLIEGAESLPPLEVKTTTTVKKKGGARSTGEDRPCGWSARLLWADEDVERWDETQEGPDDVCMAPRRRCDRHAGWLKSVPLSMTVEEQQLLRRKDVLETKLRHEKRSEEVKAAADKARDDMLRRLGVGVDKAADAVKAG